MFRQSLITDINDRNTLRAPIGSAVLALACLAGLWFAAFAFMPKTAALAELSGANLPTSFAIGSTIAAVARTLLYPAGIFVVVALLISMVGAISFPVRRIAGGFVRFALLVLVPVMGVLMTISWIGLYYVFEAQRMRATFYEHALEHFALIETINDRFDRVYGEFQSFENLQPMEIKNPAAELSASQMRVRLGMLVAALESANDDAVRMRILATLPPFESLIVADEGIRTVVMDSAKRTARESFQDVPDFFRWLAEQPRSRGWEPLPLYRFERR